MVQVHQEGLKKDGQGLLLRQSAVSQLALRRAPEQGARGLTCSLACACITQAQRPEQPILLVNCNKN